MRRLTILVAVLAAIYSGYWFVGSRTLANGIASAQAEIRTSGWDIAYADLSTIGFPSRFDTTVTAPTVAPPDGMWMWQAPFLQIFALSYAPNEVIAVFPDEQTFRMGRQTIAIQSQDLRASAAVKASTALAFRDATVEMDAATATSDAGWAIALNSALIAMRGQEDTENAYDVYADIDELRLPQDAIARIDPDGVLTSTIDNLTIHGAVQFDQPLDRNTAEPRITGIALSSLNLQWGGLTINGDGAITVDEAGVPEGRVTLKTRQWREMIELLVNAGLIRPGMAGMVTNTAQSLAASDGTLDLPVSFQSGFMSVGPIPLGPAPRLP
ncbi:DUF2125 domain-containing protein [Yoonia sp. 2307UL14-13]|uniref:DUF2125 domain-containing protein n=1 Tax=Yoonia sp. 2307UL14-13 TaxID=3126506 RepID=UPI0030A617E7